SASRRLKRRVRVEGCGFAAEPQPRRQGRAPMNIHVSKLIRSSAYIDGQWLAASDGSTFDVTDPADGALIIKVADCTAQDALTAVAAAERAFPGWQATPAKERGRLLRRWFEL